MPGSARSRRREEERQRETGGEPNRALPQRQPRLRVRPQTRPRPQTHPSTPSKYGAGVAVLRCAARLGAVLGLVSKAPAERSWAQRAAAPPSGDPGPAPTRVPRAAGAPRVRTPRPARARLRLRGPGCRGELPVPRPVFQPPPRNSSGSGNCTSSGGGRPGPGPAGWEPQERERAEEGEEEGKEEEEERSTPKEKDREEWRETQRCHAGGDLGEPLAATTAEAAPPAGSGVKPPPPASQTFRGDALRGEVRPPKRTGQPLIAACAPELLGPGGPGEGTTQHLRRPGPPAQLGGRGREFANSALEFGGGSHSSRKNLPLPPQLPPPPLPCSPFANQTPPVPVRPSCHVGPRRPQGP
ncbi:hypothetical protein J1605_016627 [Eschrichtius robustus]|uniref:Basic proline-rich protein-like n=1 Tax=Eschrichtius robustus TaxID=9764 RepID=A0AB34I5I5_ESCRO|nr:hypothetical protein J1605_016627 [Eschrichtius robustus]